MSASWIGPEGLKSVRRSVKQMVEGEAPQSDLVCGLIERVLTPQQMRVLALMGEGKDNQEIAEAMGITAKVVSVHKHNLRQTLALPHSPAVVVAAVRYVDARRKGGAQ